jgi:C4-type Zn-finger protein
MKKVTKKEATEWKQDPATECPLCGAEMQENFDMGDIDIDVSTGFVALKMECDECGGKFVLFFDYDRTEKNDD